MLDESIRGVTGVDALDEHLANVICNLEGSWRANGRPRVHLASVA